MDIPVSKVIIHKLSGEVSLVEQDKIENISYSQVFIKQTRLIEIIWNSLLFLRFFLTFFQLHFMQLFSLDATIFLKYFEVFLGHENIKTMLKIGPNFFFSIANRPKTSQNLNCGFMKIAHHMTYV